jgi:hypothetical protein
MRPAPQARGALRLSSGAAAKPDYKMSVPPPAGTGTAAFQRDEKKALEITFCGP